MMQFCAEQGCGVIVQFGRCPEHERAQDRRRPVYASFVHRWYGSKRWQLLRADVIRDQPFCVVCLANGHKVPTVDVDHVRKHEGNPDLFWDRANLQGLCHPCHTAKTARGE